MKTYISENFYLEEFTMSQTSERMGRPLQLSANMVEAHNIVRLVRDILQPVRSETGKSYIVTSGYRPEWLNTAIGGSKKSQHMSGEAADGVTIGMSTLQLCQLIIDMDLPFNQVINEFGRWVHVSVAPLLTEPKREILTAYKEHGKTKYFYGLEDV